MTYKDFKYYFLGSLFVVSITFAVIELTTRTISWVSGKGFSLALHELEPYDKKVESMYEWHPFTGMIFQADKIIYGGHSRQARSARIFVDKYGFLSKDNILEYEKASNEIRIATIGASTTASINLTSEENWPGQLGTLVQQAFPNKKIR